MSFQPVLPLSGYAGWIFLNRTAETQKAAFNESPAVSRVTDAFRERISNVKTAEDLVNDRALLTVALGAFGLDDDINNRFFIKKVLSEGTVEPDALANRMADSRYKDLAKAFGFGELEPTRTGFSFFPGEIIERYEARQFELAVGEQNNDLRLAMNSGSALKDVVAGNSTNDGRWFAMMGNSPLRNVFQTALGFPTSFAAIDLDQQLEQFKSRAEATFGTSDLAEIQSEENQEKLVRLFLLRSEMNAITATSSGSIALSLLQQIPRPT